MNSLALALLLALSQMPAPTLHQMVGETSHIAVVSISSDRVRLTLPSTRHQLTLYEARILRPLRGDLRSDDFIVIATMDNTGHRQFLEAGEWVAFLSPCGGFFEIPYGRDGIRPIIGEAIRGAGPDGAFMDFTLSQSEDWPRVQAVEPAPPCLLQTEMLRDSG